MTEQKLWAIISRFVLSFVIIGGAINLLLDYGEVNHATTTDWKSILSFLMVTIGIAYCGYLVGQDHEPTK